MNDNVVETNELTKRYGGPVPLRHTVTFDSFGVTLKRVISRPILFAMRAGRWVRGENAEPARAALIRDGFSVDQRFSDGPLRTLNNGSFDDLWKQMR